MKRKLFYFFLVVCVIAVAVLILIKINGKKAANPPAAAHAGERYLYPDSRLTPGSVDPRATAECVCTPGYTASVRDVPLHARKEVFKEYGIDYPPPHGAYEVDHFIPLELGGSNDIKNLWPEPADPHPGFHEKDHVENYLHHEVCSGRMTLREAQEEIRIDWYKVYTNLPRK